jgi:hypothetical protein
VLANHIAGVPVPASNDAPVYEQALAAAKINSRAVKMATYGAFISAPMNHVLVGMLQKMFAGRTSVRDKLLQLLVSNIFIAPIQAGGTKESLFAGASLLKCGFLSVLGIYGRYFRSQITRCDRSCCLERNAPVA